jgi:nucleoside diphosphate kinase
MDKTFFLLKPDCLDRGLIYKCYEKLRFAGFVIDNMILVHLDPDTITRLYYPFTIANAPAKYKSMKQKFIIEYLSSGLCSYIKVHLDASVNFNKPIFDFAREVQGFDYYPEHCQSGSIRFDLRNKEKDGTWITLENIPNFGNVAGEIVYNLVHTPANIEEYQHQAKILDRCINSHS